MLKIHKFARKPFYVDAVRVSKGNVDEVADWCGGEIRETDSGEKFISVQVHRSLTERQTQAFFGDWVLFAGSGFKVYTPRAFDKWFEKVKTLNKAQADAAGIKVPHEKRPDQKKGSGRPVPKAPSQRQAVTNVGQAIREAQEAKVPEPVKEKDEADRLIDEVLNEE